MKSNILALSVVATSAVENFDGHQVLRVVPDTDEQVRVLRGMDENDQFDFWSDARAAGKPVDIRCSPETCDDLRAALVANQIENVKTMISDVQDSLDQMLPTKLGAPREFSIEEYQSYDATYAWMEQLAEQYSDICELIDVGTSYEGRAIKVIKITGNKAAKAGKKAFWMDGGIHAREWITVGAMNYMLSKTLEGYGSDDTVTSIVDSLNIYYAPIINPDGYDFTWTKNRMWRKTMKPNKSSPSCVGTDPNRNWDYHWNEAGSSSNPCSESYAGAAPADNPEVVAVQDFIRTKDDFLGYINFHSYGQLWMSPWGWTSQKPKDYEVQHAAGTAAVNALKAVHGTSYENGPISTTIYPASGSSADYTYGTCNVLFSYGVELRDTGLHGFVLPANQIVPTGEETFEGIKALANYMIAHEANAVVV